MERSANDRGGHAANFHGALGEPSHDATRLLASDGQCADQRQEHGPCALVLPALVPAPAGCSGAVLLGDFLPGRVVVEDPADAVEGLAEVGLGAWVAAGENTPDLD